jgi:HK97 gp10 family phage protein
VARVRKSFLAFAAAAPEAALAALLKTGEDVLDVAKQLVPVDTQSLKDSGGVVPVDSQTVHVGFGGPGVYYEGREPEKYAEFVEFGTSQSPAQPYLRPAAMQAESTFEARMREELEKVE